MGVDDLTDGQEYQGTILTNPAEQVYFHALAYGLKGGSAEVFMQVKIEYTSWFLEPRELSPALAKQIENLTITELLREEKAVNFPSLPGSRPTPSPAPVWAPQRAVTTQVPNPNRSVSQDFVVVPRSTIDRLRRQTVCVVQDDTDLEGDGALS